MGQCDGLINNRNIQERTRSRNLLAASYLELAGSGKKGGVRELILKYCRGRKYHWIIKKKKENFRKTKTLSRGPHFELEIWKNRRKKAVRRGPTVFFNGNHTTFLVQFEIYLLACYLQKAQIALAIRAHAVLILLKNTPAQVRLHSLCIQQWGGGGGVEDFWGGLKIFLREKWGLVKISEGRKGECQFF